MTSSAPAVRAHHRTALAVVLSAGLTVALTACAGEDPDQGTNGVGKLTAAQIEKKALAAADAAEAVRLTGKLVSKGGTYSLNMQLSGEGGTGSVTSSKNTFALLRIGDELFLKADSRLLEGREGRRRERPGRRQARRQVREGARGRPHLPAAARLHGEGDAARRDAVPPREGQQGRPGHGRRGAHRADHGGKGEGGALDVSLKGTPYPLRVARGGGGGTVSLADWGKAFPLEAPAEDDTVDYGGELPRSSG